MKNLLLVLLLLSSAAINAQQSNCLDTNNALIYGLDTNDFDDLQTAHFRLDIDTADTTNLWMIGAISKPGFPAAYSGTNAIQTDTALPYAANSNSVFYVWRDTNFLYEYTGDLNAPFSISFWHYYDVDTLLDSCIVQVTADSGKTWTGWYNLQPLGFAATYWGSLSNTQPNSSRPHRFLFTGSSGGWVQERICLTTTTVVNKTTAAFNDDFGYRFLFKSDGINSGKPGWMIDDIQMTTPVDYGTSVDDIQSNPLSIYPNPSSTGLYSISYPANYVTGLVSVYDVFGRRVYEAQLSKTINLSALPSGTYLYRARFSNYEQVYTGHVIRE